MTRQDHITAIKNYEEALKKATSERQRCLLSALILTAKSYL